jgi:hypothetical protein
VSKPENMQELVSRLKTSVESGTDEIGVSRDDLERVLAFAEKTMAVAESAQTLLVNSYSLPDDDKGVRFLSEDAVRLQWALREIGIGDDSGEPCFTV